MVSISSSASPQPGRGRRFGTRSWYRLTQGLALNQLWNQFRTDARMSYRLYSGEINSIPREGIKKGRLWFAKQFLWAILEKLSPARRVFLLVALLMILFRPNLSHMTNEGTQTIIELDFRLWGGLLMFFLLILEISDRFVMKRDLQIAREIQTWLLPTFPPHVPGMEIAFETRPANTVAGDYYDIFPRATLTSANQSYLIVVADVVGKSIPAALLMATFQASLKTLSATPSSLEQLVDGMNRYACSNSQGGLRFTTAFLAEYDAATRSLTYVNAGHNRPILRHSSGLIERLDVGGLPLGIEAHAIYQTGTVTVKTGDWLVVFTDGVVEGVNETGTDYGEERLFSTINASAETSPANMLSQIVDDLGMFIGNTPQQDDITCLVMKAV